MDVNDLVGGKTDAMACAAGAPEAVVRPHRCSQSQGGLHDERGALAMTQKSHLVALLGTLTAMASCEVPRTQLLVGVDTDLPWGPGARVQSVSLEIRHGSATGALRDQRVTALGSNNGRRELPLWVTVLSADDHDTSPLWIEALGCATADGCTRDTAVVKQRASVTFVPGQSGIIRLLLAGACATRSCALSERCAASTGTCVPIDAQSELRAYGGVLPGRWAGDAAATDVVSHDATAPDVGVVPEAGSTDASSSADLGVDADAATTDAGPTVDSASPCPLDMAYIPAGTFVMGDADATSFGAQPPHMVTLSAYCMDLTEVTVAAYRACTAVGCTTPTTGSYFNWGVSGRDNHPINGVDWSQSRAYCQSLGRDLPTEAQWEYAARGADVANHIYPWGNAAPSSQLCWNALPSSMSTCSVGTYPSGNSSFGLFDMAGNVWEWTQDWYALYPSTAASDPTGPLSPPSSASRVYRGGSWNLSVRAAYRNLNTPTVRRNDVGFRCALGAM